ncbi:inositol monophosphatase family protein [Metabacillus litoralis]|uniref:inositol monophosphatase family protein n=1 Tax=Metabacillus TaxID=2675233 RepID=UPI000EF5EB00|nr:inositol monophosphatase family protein [Metabacillus litoralis]MCM3160343.1 inositol monophosphatase family protein [Metabacillus litoralis]MCM3408928.1 inositol monophosphatase family protein [Metabacillus litoralis]UHA59431.1 inositol monophosphatase family protein [Metabacillus litoralis]
MTNWKELDQRAKQWVEEAGELIRNSFDSALSIQYKSNPNDLVTNMDKEVEQYLISKIQETYPDHKILGEEGYGDKVESLDGVVWIIDPIDGTMNFVHQQRNFAISVGVYGDGIGYIGLIYDVVHKELYHAFRGEGAYMNELPLPKLDEVKIEQAILSVSPMWVTENKRFDHQLITPIVKRVRGTRSYGSAALECAYVAAGRLDAYMTMRLAPWDFAAGLVLLEEVGANASTLSGEKLDLLNKNSFFIGEQSLHQYILKEFLVK